MSTTVRTIEELNREAIGILFRELGIAEAMRFLEQFIERSGDYTRDRHALLGDPTLEELFAEARRREALRAEHAGAR
jgi:hypothetical protein